MTDNITLTGLVATEPRFITTPSGVDICTFRLASAQRRFDKDQKRWVDGDTNWYTIVSFRGLAANVRDSVHRSDRIVVTGRLKLREWEKDGKRGVNVDVEADTLGHDLFWGVSQWTRSLSSVDRGADQQEPSEERGASPERDEEEWAPPQAVGMSTPF